MENREQSLIPFLLQTSLSHSYLLQNLMLQELFREASQSVETRNMKQKGKRKLYKKNWKEALHYELRESL